MVFLLVAHYIHHLVDGVVLVAQLGGTYVLCHIYRCAVGAEQQLLVESVAGEVSPYRTVLTTIEQTLFESAQHLLFAFKISLRLVVYLIEADAHTAVGLIEAGIHP